MATGANFTITRGYSIAGGMSAPAWRTITRGYGLGTVPESGRLNPLVYSTPARPLDALALAQAVDAITPARPLGYARSKL